MGKLSRELERQRASTNAQMIHMERSHLPAPLEAAEDGLKLLGAKALRKLSFLARFYIRGSV